MTDKLKLSDAQLLQEITTVELERNAFFEIASGFTLLATATKGMIGRSGYDLSSSFYTDLAERCVERLRLLAEIKRERGL